MTFIVITTFGCCGIFPSWYNLSLLLCFEFDNLLELLKFFIRQESVSLFYIIWEKPVVDCGTYDELMFSDYSCLY